MTKSPSIAVKTLLVLAVAGSMAAFFVQPAAAQTATGLKCKGCLTSKQVKNGKLKGKDLKDSTVTGSKIAPAAVDSSKIAPNAVDSSKIADGAVGSSELSSSVTVGGGVTLDGATGDVTNSLSGNGLVKAWARIEEDGSIVSCWRCNTDTGETRRIATGFYEVDFTPLGTDISARPRSLVLDNFDGAGSFRLTSSVFTRGGDPSSVEVRFFDHLNNTNVDDDAPFSLVIY